MLGEEKTEQFVITTRVNGELIREQRIHDPFLFSKTEVGISRLDLFKALFKKQYKVTVQISVSGTEGVQRAIMMLDPKQLEAETQAILEDRKLSRESSLTQGHCFTAEG